MKKYLFLLATAMLAFSCGGDDTTNDGGTPGPVTPPPAPEASISLSASDHLFAKEEGQFEVTVTSTGDWEVLGGGDGFTVAPKEGQNGDKATISVTANPTAETRSCEFTFVCGEKTAVFKAAQAGGDELTIATTAYTAPVTGGSIMIEVRASGAYTYEVENAAENGWLHKPAAEAAALETTTVELVADANDTGKARMATVNFTLGEISVPVTVTQAQNDVLRVAEGTALTLSFDKVPAEGQEFSFETNILSDVNITADEWITVSAPVAASNEEGVQSYTVTVTAAENEGAPREGKVTIAAAEGKGLEAIEITVSQDGETPLPEGSVRIPDANFRAKLLSLGYIESADDEVCALTEAGKTATEMNVNRSNIADLTGIEAFTNLENLIIWGNPEITRLDLSHNPKITALNINQLTNLSYVNFGAINISIWFSLVNLTCTELTVISTGTFSNTFECNGSNVKSADFSQCTGFTTVTMTGWQNLEGTLDLHNCANLQKLTLNNCPKLSKLILPASRQGEMTYSPGGGVNPALEVVYE